MNILKENVESYDVDKNSSRITPRGKERIFIDLVKYNEELWNIDQYTRNIDYTRRSS